MRTCCWKCGARVQAPSDVVLFENRGDGVLRELLPRGRYPFLPEPYHPHARLLSGAGLITEPSAVKDALYLWPAAC